MEFVIVESPFAGDMEANTEYARRACAYSLARCEAPFASHLIYTQHGITDDTDPVQRAIGMAASMAVASRGDRTAVYYDRGLSSGIIMGIENAFEHNRPIELRSLDGAPVPPELLALLDRYGDGHGQRAGRSGSRPGHPGLPALWFLDDLQRPQTGLLGNDHRPHLERSGLVALVRAGGRGLSARQRCL